MGSTTNRLAAQRRPLCDLGALVYKLNRRSQVKAEFREEWLRSTVPTADYMATVMLLGLRLQR